ncbi:SPFH domain-containing protein [Desulfovibrio sp. OttesenSCG-928-C06]|nr:SPFH domain-containing protein [Desulfovibrio sp. OttesenSCG-928-C06]
MGLFSKNPNETAYTGGKKHWVDVIKNSGAPDLLIWRQPEEDFNTSSTLIVFPSEEAIFYKGGVAEQIFDEGTYKLSTENYPFISRIRNAFSGGISVFNCVVYFVRKAHSMEILWGTDSPIQLRDPVYGIATSIKARGAYKVQINNGAKFLGKLLGHNADFATQNELNKYFRNEFMQHIKSTIAREIMESKQEILGIAAEQDVLAQKIQTRLGDILDDYGLTLVNFSIAALDIDAADPERKSIDHAYARKNEALIWGDDYGRISARDTLADVAGNPGPGGLAAAGAGVGLGLGVMPLVGNMAQQMTAPAASAHNAPSATGMHAASPAGSPANSPAGAGVVSAASGNSGVPGAAASCHECGARLADNAKFCGQCGSKVPVKRFCVECGSEQPEGAKFCSGCGQKLV